MTNVPACLPLREGEEAQTSKSERMETGRQERRYKQVAAEIDEYRLERERARKGDKGG